MLETKIKTRSIQRSDFDVLIGRVFAPLIAKKIIKEYTFSYDYNPKESFPGSIVYEVGSLNTRTLPKGYEVDVSSAICTCLRAEYRGWPCRHLFSVWRARGCNVVEKTIECSHQRWRLAQQAGSITSERTPIRPRNSDDHLITVDLSNPFPQGLNQIQFKSEVKKNATPKASKKRQYEESVQSKAKKEDKITKAIKIDNSKDSDLFPFIRCAHKSCKYDVTLALFYLLYKDFPTYFVSSNTKTQDLTKILTLVESSPNDARDLLENFSLTKGNLKGHFSVSILIKDILNTDYKCFNMLFSRTTTCTNRNCPTTSKAIHEFENSILEEVNIESGEIGNKGIIETYFLPSMITETTLPCKCNFSRRPTSSVYATSYQVTTTFEVTEIPNIIIINLEKFYEEKFGISFDVGNNQRLQDLNLQDLLNIKLEDEIKFEYSNQLCRFSLKAVVYLENNHFTISYKNPKFLDVTYEGWSYYHGSGLSQTNTQSNVFVKTFNSFSLSFTTMVFNKRIPVTAIYSIDI